MIRNYRLPPDERPLFPDEELPLFDELLLGDELP
jgi:hypothetical protein